MKLRQHLLSNYRPARLHVALVALLYVFLCTFGALTHDHARGENDNAFQSVQSSSASPFSDASHVSTEISRERRTDNARLSAVPAHCAYCDWQANSLARIVTPARFLSPYTIAFHYQAFCTPRLLTCTARSSSRAPPAA